MGVKILKPGITRRWFFNTFTLILLIICVVVAIASVAVRRYYFSTAVQTLQTKADIDSAYFAEFFTSKPELTASIKSYVESFPDKSRIELMVSNPSGKITLTSSGFSAAETNYSDITDAINSGRGSYIGKNNGSESIIAVSRSVELDGQPVCILRYVISAKYIVRRIYGIVGICCVFGIVLLLVVMWSGRYFVKSIVKPIGNITETAKIIAQNDFSVRIEDSYRDEIGELAMEINNMAAALGASETLKNDFTSSISHELLTPLTAIRGWSETLSDPNMRTTEMIDKGMRVINSETSRLSAMVEELLDFSRLQSGRIAVKMVKIDLIAELEESVIMFEERAKKNNISMAVTAPDTCSPVLGDSSRIRQVFVNILDNAFKYSPDGGNIEINLFEKKNSVCIVFSDSGIGISPEDLPRVKQKFFKGSSALPGSGIGLAIVNDIMTLHGGQFEIDSTLDKGTNVFISFPAMQIKEKEDKQ